MRLTLLIALLLTGSLCAAKKRQMRIEDVMLKADLIVVGEIVQVGDTTYVFHVLETIHGDTSLHMIDVDAWKEWTCDWRDFKVKKGQRLVLLLGKEGAHYRPINASTGEIPIVNDSIVLRHEVRVPGEDHPYHLPLQEFTAGARTLRSCCRPSAASAEKYVPDRVNWSCTAEEVAAYAAREDFTGWIFRKVQVYRVEGG